MVKERNHAIDIMKGIAILCVILGHIEAIPEVGKGIIFSFHMPLFFIIAGYFYRPTVDYRAKLNKDFKRLIVPYIATGGVLCVYSFLVHFIINDDHENAYLTFWACLFPSGLSGLISANSFPIWFLFALFWCRQVYNFIFTKFKLYFAIIAILFLSIGASLLYEYGSIKLPFAFMQGLSGMIFYLIGWLINKFKDCIRWYFGLLSFLIWIGCFRFCGVSMIDCSYQNMPLAIVVAVCGTISVYYISKGLTELHRNSITKIIPIYLEWAGVSSLVILCIHTVERYLPIWGIVGLKSIGLLFIGKVLLCSIITLLCYKFRLTRSIFQLKK